MNSPSLDDMFAELLQLWEAKSGPFPYVSCYELQETYEVDSGLIPDLDYYFMQIAGYSSWGKKLFKMPHDERLKAIQCLSRDFFTVFPEYECIREPITEQYPDLSRWYRAHEIRRLLLLEIFRILMA